MSNILVVGRREEGKSTLAMYLARQRHIAIVVFDPRGMFDGHVVWSPEELEDAIDSGIYKDGRPIVYRFDSGDAVDHFPSLCSVLFPNGFTRGGFCLVVDEAAELQTANSIDKNLKRAIAQHPTKPLRDKCTIIQTSHRLAEFHGKSKALMDELYIFCTTHPRDLDALVDHTGQPELVEVVTQLPKHHCVRYMYARQSSGVSQYEVWDDPTIWVSDIEKGGTIDGAGAGAGTAGRNKNNGSESNSGEPRRRASLLGVRYPDGTA